MHTRTTVMEIHAKANGVLRKVWSGFGFSRHEEFLFLAEEVSVNAWIYKDHAYSKKGGKYGALGPQR